MSDLLQDIIAAKKMHLAQSKQRAGHSAIEAQAKAAQLPRDFYGALKKKHTQERTALITEIKKASPSAGVMIQDYDPAALAQIYEKAGASCLSVLTDTPYFEGKDEDLVAARAACALPVLRKDFIIDPYQVVESRALGADCVLLIMACLSDAQAQELLAAAASHHLSILVEVHDENEMDRALRLPSAPKTMLGINNRNLKTLAIDLSTTARLAARLDNDYMLVSESGIRTHADIIRLKQAGVHCFLVGENLLKAEDIGRAVAELLHE